MAFGAKQSSELYYVLFDFDEDLNPTDSDGTSLATDSLASIATVSVIDQNTGYSFATLVDTSRNSVDSTKAWVWVKDGTSGHNYKITVLINTNSNAKYEMDGILPVRDK